MTRAALKIDEDGGTSPQQPPESVGIVEHWGARRGKIISESLLCANPRLSTAKPTTVTRPDINDRGFSIGIESTPVPELPHFSPTQPRAESFSALQEWEGEVTEIFADYFRARLIDITADESVPNEVAEIPTEDLQPEDVSRLKTGAHFHWVIGYAVSASGTKIRGSRVYFRRIPQRRPFAAPDLIFED